MIEYILEFSNVVRGYRTGGNVYNLDFIYQLVLRNILAEPRGTILKAWAHSYLDLTKRYTGTSGLTYISLILAIVDLAHWRLCGIAAWIVHRLAGILISTGITLILICGEILVQLLLLLHVRWQRLVHLKKINKM